MYMNLWFAATSRLNWTTNDMTTRPRPATMSERPRSPQQITAPVTHTEPFHMGNIPRTKPAKTKLASSRQPVSPGMGGGVGGGGGRSGGGSGAATGGGSNAGTGSDTSAGEGSDP